MAVGWARTRIAILLPCADVGPETVFCAMAPNGISIHAARGAVEAVRCAVEIQAAAQGSIKRDYNTRLTHISLGFEGKVICN